MQVDRLRAGGANSIIDEFINYYEDRGALEKDEIGWTDLHWLRCMPPRHAPMRRAPRAQRPPRVPCPAQGAARRACRYVGGVVAEKRITEFWQQASGKTPDISEEVAAKQLADKQELLRSQALKVGTRAHHTRTPGSPPPGAPLGAQRVPRSNPTDCALARVRARV